MRTTIKKLNTRIYYANQALTYTTNVLHSYLSGYNQDDRTSRELNLAYQNLEQSWYGVCENVDRKFRVSKIRGRQNLINYLVDINLNIMKYIRDLNEVDSFYYTNHHIEIEKDTGKYYHTKALNSIKRLLREVK